jgi:hypothetical protein
MMLANECCASATPAAPMSDSLIKPLLLFIILFVWIKIKNK